MKKIKLFILIILLIIIPSLALAVNSYATKLVLANSQYWSITDASQTGLDISGDMTIELWIKITQLPSSIPDFMRIARKWISTTDRAFSFFFNQYDDIVLYFCDATACSKKLLSGVLVASDVGKWVHFAVVADVSVPDIRIYKNGIDQGGIMELTDATSIFNSTADFMIGSQNGTTRFFDGQIDEFRIWSVARTQDEITSNMWTELKGNEANLEGYWKFNNNGNDSTSNGNNLTNNNSATFVSETPFLHDYNGALFFGSF